MRPADFRQAADLAAASRRVAVQAARNLDEALAALLEPLTAAAESDALPPGQRAVYRQLAAAIEAAQQRLHPGAIRHATTTQEHS